MKRFMGMILMAAVVVTSVVVPNSNNVETVKAAEVDAGVTQVASGAAISAPITAPTKTETGAYKGYETYIDFLKSRCTRVVSLDAEVYAIDWSDVQHKKYYMSYREYLIKANYVIPEEYTMVMTNSDINDPLTYGMPFVMCKPDGTEDILYKTDGYGCGYDKDGYDRRGYDFWGYDREGYDEFGYDREGYKRDGYNDYGLDRNGLDEYGCDKNGINKELLCEEDIVFKFSEKEQEHNGVKKTYNPQDVTDNHNKIKYVKNLKTKIAKYGHVFLQTHRGGLYELKNPKLTMQKVSVNKNGYGTYNLVIDSKEYGILTLKVVVLPSGVRSNVMWFLDKRIDYPYATVYFSNEYDATGVQYTIGKVKNSDSKKFIKTYKKMTFKKFSKKGKVDMDYIKNIKRNEIICVKYRAYASIGNNKKIYSEWDYHYVKLK